ncbi:nucleotidyltransferase domain-containing protein [Streptomyces sp. TRM S81-3]|uniref:Nucleotidyltransferase domain-containing protein n=1 Tax=Streptomyces griseicoloratus TaxID=2752516 RepID=A0A926L0B6_9ACTN|nr:nucleotidyltransferase domain-containing protein [Streptomyces griseicoloratus]MBD0418191.1 nucleotidyltransferase domain-containing protein [Streptomyces griseicoloratus]
MSFPSPSPAPSACPALDARIERLRELARADSRLEGVLLYGSWTTGEADAHSDIEAYLYVRDEHVDDFDGPAFVARLAPLQLAYTNMYGILAVVFDDLMRGEFHICAAGAGIEEVPTWEGMVHLPSPEKAVLLDRTGRLTRAAERLARFRPPEPVTTARQLTHELANWTLMLAHVLARGEVARAHALLHSVIAPQQLQLCRLLRGTTAHWLTPSRALEQDLPAADRDRYTGTTAAARSQEVRTAARNSWRWSRDLAAEAAERWGIDLPRELHRRIGDLLDDRR